MSGPHENILRRKIDAGVKRLANASLKSVLVTNIEKETSKVFLDLLKLEVSASVTQRTIGTQVETIEALTSILYGIVGFGDNIGLAGFDERFINSTIATLAGGSLDPNNDRRATVTDAAIFKLRG